MKTTTQKRKTVELQRVRIPLRSLLHDQSLNTAAQRLKDYRVKLGEQEFFHQADLTIKWDSYSEVYLVATRPETDEEYSKRLEEARAAQRIKEERAKKRAEKAAQRALVEEQVRQQKVLETIKSIVKANNLTPEQVQALLK